MSDSNKSILIRANGEIRNGKYEAFLEYCSEGTRWEFVGDRTLKGKNAMRAYLEDTYSEPPRFNVKDLISEGDFVTAIVEIEIKENGSWKKYDYCDVWKFKDNQMAELRGFVIPKKA